MSSSSEESASKKTLIVSVFMKVRSLETVQLKGLSGICSLKIRLLVKVRSGHSVMKCIGVSSAWWHSLQSGEEGSGLPDSTSMMWTCLRRNPCPVMNCISLPSFVFVVVKSRIVFCLLGSW